MEYTESAVGRKVLDNWNESLASFVRVIPKDYKRMLQQIRKVQDQGLQGEAALLAAFEANMRELARAGN
ncbi:Ferredoxin-dependent glutamate synthase 1 [compost metagenome]